MRRILARRLIPISTATIAIVVLGVWWTQRARSSGSSATSRRESTSTGLAAGREALIGSATVRAGEEVAPGTGRGRGTVTSDEDVVEAHVLFSQDAELVTEIESAVVQAIAGPALACAAKRASRTGAHDPTAGDVVRFTPILRVAAGQRTGRIEEVVDVRWPGDYDDQMRSCLAALVRDLEYTTNRAYSLTLALPVGVVRPGFQPPASTDVGP
jgi:hypothetical protein